jgi:hypothetical protein
MIAEPITSIPWQCGDKDCTDKWHKATVWIADSSETGYTRDEFSDGDHDEIDEKDLPSFDEQDKEWKEYAEYVAQNGDDPLSEYIVPTKYKRHETWQIEVTNSIGCARLLRSRKNGRGKWLFWQQLPENIAEYLGLTQYNQYGGKHDRSSKMDDWKNVDELISHTKDSIEWGPKLKKWKGLNIRKGLVKIPVWIDRKESAVSRDLKKAARKTMEETNG